MTIDRRTYPFATDDPFRMAEEFAPLRARDPIPRVTLVTGDEALLVTRYDDARAVLADQRFSNNLNRPNAARLTAAGNLSSPFADPPVHTRWRRFVSRAFTARQVDGLRDRAGEIADQLVDEMAAAGPPADLMEAFAFPFSVTVICEMVGIPTVDRQRFRRWVDTTLSISREGADEKLGAQIEMFEYTRQLVEAKRGQLGDDLVSRLIAVYDDDEDFTEDDLIVTILALVIGGYESTAHQIAKSLLALFRHPDQLAALVGDLTLVPHAVEEMLRYASLDSGFGQPRFATEDIQVGDVVVPRGSTLLVVRQSANRDETKFEDPYRFDVTRPTAGQHIAFGLGPHFCVGAALARVEMRVAFETLLSRLRGLGPDPSAPPVGWEYRVAASGPDVVPVTWTGSSPRPAA